MRKFRGHPSAQRADMEDALRGSFEYRAASLDQFLISADHVAHRPQLRAARSSAYWRIDYADASARALRSDFTNGGRPYRAMDCDYAAWSRPRNYPIVAHYDSFDLGVIHHRNFDNLASGGDLARRIRCPSAHRDQFFDRFA